MTGSVKQAQYQLILTAMKFANVLSMSAGLVGRGTGSWGSASGLSSSSLSV